ncbi:2Fe-2S iron-sulfur cluster-binding protein [Streptomyces sp. LHD-70]|uniref:(2Fe-2S)-binding protein n=1 Tax=Streptomyces sp. LHD-70 TaxID=3072140 RepID=UPI00280ED01D|nr:2Fe-2S iron-sulfur cluster-binding protein [Streptomyces sp. LHD-70]MDQ8702374.1 2Fe-2S iron-sulfur cluster-binding protein [Streptomyces sp. LHD-70]
MSPRRVRAESDAVGRQDRPLRITVDGEAVDGIAGQTIAGVLLAADRLAWRRGRSGAPRGVFCGIGVCFDCLVTVGEERDVRACRRRARDGDMVTTQTREPQPREPSTGEPSAGEPAPAPQEFPASPDEPDASAPPDAPDAPGTEER